MKNDSTPRGDCFSCKFCQELNKEYYCHRTTAHEKVDANYDCEDFLSKSQQHNVTDSTQSKLGDTRSTLGDIERETRSTPSEGWGKEIKNYECREYDGIKWIRYDHYLDALSSQLKEVRSRIEALQQEFVGKMAIDALIKLSLELEAELSQLAEGEEE